MVPVSIFMALIRRSAPATNHEIHCWPEVSQHTQVRFFKPSSWTIIAFQLIDEGCWQQAQRPVKPGTDWAGKSHMGSHYEFKPSDEEDFSVEEISQESEQDESLVNWRLIGTAIISTILIISIILGMIGPAIIQPDFQIKLPTATPTTYPFLIGFEF